MQIIPSGNNFVSFGLGLGYSFTSNKVKFAYFPEPQEIYNYPNGNSFIYGTNVVASGGVIINLQIGYSWKIPDDYYLNFRVGYKIQSYSIRPIYYGNYYSYYSDKDILHSFQVTLGLSKKNTL